MTSFPLLAPHKWRPLGAAWAIALLSSLAVLFVGEVMGQTPCVLCWYQRVFMFPLAIVLGVGVFREDTRVWLYAGPLALVGFLIAAYHSLLYFGFVAEALKPCGKGPSCSDAAMTILGMPIPLLSLASFAVVIVLLALVNKRSAS